MQKDLNQLKRVIWFITDRMMVCHIRGKNDYEYNFKKYKAVIKKETRLYIIKTIIKSNEEDIIEQGLVLFEHNFGTIDSLIDQCHNFSLESIYPLDNNDIIKLYTN